jgi:hypothetical protein
MPSSLLLDTYARQQISEQRAEAALQAGQLRAEVEEAAVASKQQAHLAVVTRQNHQAELELRDAHVAAATKEVARLREVRGW